jgi:hypothetical protein
VTSFANFADPRIRFSNSDAELDKILFAVSALTELVT